MNRIGRGEGKGWSFEIEKRHFFSLFYNYFYNMNNNLFVLTVITTNIYIYIYMTPHYVESNTRRTKLSN